MIEIINCEQNSDEWKRARLGIPTASAFAHVMAKGEGKVRRKYMYELLAERISGEPNEGFFNSHMERGHAMEEEGRDLYAFNTDHDLERVGFIRNVDKGCSPDSLINKDGMLELKTRLPYLQIELLVADRVPPEHVAQLQGTLWVAERTWIDFVSYSPKLPLFVKRVMRDDAYITRLASEVSAFNEELTALHRKFLGVPS